jgi:hypothetical protein
MHVVASFHRPHNHVGAHSAEADHAELHRFLSTLRFVMNLPDGKFED